ncbi:MAG: hypothetical protein WCG84_01275 [Candidatus Moraniibacteriota bacterium]
MKNIQAFAKRTLVSLAVIGLIAPTVVFGQWSSGISNAQSGGTPSGTIFGIIKTTMNWLLGILGFLGIIGFVIAGILYLTAAGDEKRMEKGKNTMIWSITGVIVALLGFVIIQAATSWLGGSSTTF